jgi:hypothetical protein
MAGRGRIFRVTGNDPFSINSRESLMLIPVSALGKGMRVEWIDFYGHTLHACILHAWISDAAGKRTAVCIDGRENSPTRNRLFQQARHPKKPGAVLVELGAPEEGVVIPLLSKYLDSGGPKALGLTEYGWELAREILLRFGESEGCAQD